MPFRTLLYRYFFFGWLFRDPGGADDNLFERAAIQRHNRRQASWLPLYMLRWTCCALLLYCGGSVAELGDDGAVLHRLLYVASAGCASFAISIAVAWLGLRRDLAI